MNLLTTPKYIHSKIKKLFGKSPDDFRITIGEVLRRKGIITEKQLQEAIKVQKEKLYTLGKAVRLGQIIVELGYASEEELVKAVNVEYQISVKTLADDIKGLVKDKRGNFVEGLPSPRIPIWLQLFAATMVIIITTIFVMSFFILSQQKERLYRQTVKIGKISLNYFSSNSPVPLLEDNILRLNTLIKDATAVEGLLYAIIVDRNQIIKAHTDITKIGKTFEKFAHLEDVKKEQDVTYFNYYSKFGQNVLNLTRPVLFKGKKLGQVHVGVSIDFIEKLIHKARLTIVVITFFIILFGSAIAVWLGFHFSRPISNLVMATGEIASGNYQHKIILARNDELGNLATAFNLMGDELWKNSLMQKSFGKYIGSEVLEMIMANPESAWLKGHRNEATIIFTDIRGFSSYSKLKEPEEIVEGLNEYFEIATQAIQDHGGYVDKFIGDAVLGVFGVPVYHKDHVERGVRAANDMQKKFMNKQNNGNSLLQSVGIGINSGVVVSGNIGSQDKMEYTVIGDTVNLAAHLNKLAGSGDIIISESVFENLKDIITVKPLSPQHIKGKTKPVETFKLLSIKDKLNATIRK
ncbi:MAG: HAMP domain-containing protein [Deltaproteobacteria bacterium]|nr:HAMP domain-containing protein [Deltaproteobacteria bacterium]MBW2643614.1 HAMP domain-containing protein [Deltaproteobacteria bacterium]